MSSIARLRARTVATPLAVGLASAFVLTPGVLTSGVARAAGFPRPSVSYSADVRLETEATSGSVDMDGKVYSTPTAERREHTMGGERGVIITRHDKQVSWVIMPQQRMYMERQSDAQKLPGESWNEGGADLELVAEGSEVINGVQTTKNRVTVTGADGTKTTGTVWLTKENIPVRMVGTNQGPAGPSTFELELSNLKVAAQDAALFEVPGGYQKFDMPSIPGLGGAARHGKGMPPGGAPPGMSEADARAMQEQIQKQLQEMQHRMQHQGH